MPYNTKSYQPVQSLTVKANEDLPAFRFVSHLGTLCSSGSRALGVTEVDWLSNQYSAVVSLGTIAIETSTTINAGADVASDAFGKAKTAESGDAVNGRALDSVTGAGFIRIKLVP
jgi:hypothetical protein